jgi:uncharacterized protein (TIGR02186 family)
MKTIQKALNISAISKIQKPARPASLQAFKLVILIAALLVIFSGVASAELTATANHDIIKIDFLYHGSTLSIRGTSDPGTDLIVKITAPDGHMALKKKGKVGGLLWMNVGEIKFDHAPGFYGVHSTKKLEDILSAEEMDKYVLGYPALERHVEISPATDEKEKDTWFREFVRYKESSKLYATSTGTISLTNADGKQNYYILTEWPYQARPGEYLVTVYAVKDKKVAEKAEANVRVEQAGIVKTLAGMAKESASAYGLLSILAALGAGFGVGLIFRKGGGAH